MDGGAGGAQCIGDSAEVVRVSGEDAVVEASSDHDKVRVDGVTGPGEGKKSADRPAVVEWVDRDGLQERGKSRLGGSTTPHLGNNRMG